MEKNIKLFFPQISFIAAYLVGNFLIIINSGVFWDDWTLFNMSFEGMKQQFTGNGFVFGAYIHYFLNKLPAAPIVYHSLVVVLQILTILWLWEILKLLNLRNKFFFWTVLLFASVPFFSAKITMICLPYVIGSFFFASATWFMQKYILNTKIIYRVGALVLFFLSFFVNSFLFFYILPFSMLFIQKNNIKLETIPQIWKTFKSSVTFKNLIRIIDFILLPFIFWTFKTLFLSPSGLYVQGNYNKITIGGFILSPFKTLQSILESVMKLPEVLSEAVLNYYMIVPAFLLFVLIYFLAIKNKTKDQKPSIPYWLLLAISFILVILAVYPYAIIGKVPVFYSYADRHQLLLPLGVAMLIVSLIYILIKEKYRALILSLVLTSFIVTNVYFNLQYIHRWIKNEALISYFEKSDFNNETVVVEDNTASDDLHHRDLRFYELCGMSKLAKGKQTNFFANFQTFKKLDLELFASYGTVYSMADYKPNVPTKVMKIEKGIRYSKKNSFILSMLKYFAPDDYQNKISEFLKISIKEVDKDMEYYNFKYSKDNTLLD